MIAGTSSMLALDGSIKQDVSSIQKEGQYKFDGVADLIGPKDARPERTDPFFDDKIAFAYRYEATDTGERYFITEDKTEWLPIMTYDTTRVNEVRVEDQQSFFDHTFARPNAPSDKDWIYTPADITQVGSELELASTTTLESTQHGNYSPGSEAIAGWAMRLTGTPTAGEGLAGYYNADDGFGVGEDTTDSFVWLRKNGTDHRVYRSNWNGTVPDSRVWVRDYPIVTRAPHLFYGEGPVEIKALLPESDDADLVTLHTFTTDNVPDSWADGAIIDQPNLPVKFESDGLTGGAVRANAAHYEFGDSNAETRINGEHFYGVTVTTTGWTPLISWEKRTGWDMVNVKPLKIDTSAVTNDIKLELQLGPTLTGETWSLPTNSSADETAVEVTQQGDQGTIDVLGERRWTGYAKGGQQNRATTGVSENLRFNLPNDKVVTLAAQAVGGDAEAYGTVGWEEFF